MSFITCFDIIKGDLAVISLGYDINPSLVSFTPYDLFSDMRRKTVHMTYKPKDGQVCLLLTPSCHSS